ncbi:hypothetical protein [Pseudomonas sp. dw_358]|uniref:hypothetical protein n=1 Tax=Pseudomonas sp. dw_358 TaxID=2720083 RepID=UPI001BD404AD|nr:hypothetical protein [Pseudomonas sp. dw_358]
MISLYTLSRSDLLQAAHDAGRLQSLLEDWQPAPQDVYLSDVPSLQMSTQVRVFAAWVTELFSRL